MTATVSNLIKLITDKGYPITTAANLITKKASAETAISN